MARRRASYVELLDPAAELRPSPQALAPRLPSLRGKAVALLDNVKPNADVILKRVGEILVSQHGAARADLVTKRGPATPAEGSVIERIASGYDAVVTGLGD